MKALLFLLLSVLAALPVFAQLNVAAGTIKRFENFKSEVVDARTIDVWLPQGYSSKKKYAVLYMHDGQMLFDSTTTWNKQEWGVDETLSKLIAEKKIKECIVVGVWNNGNKRAAEYFPQKAINYIPEERRNEFLPMLGSAPLADHYLTFLVKEVKPFIDSAFSTHRDRSNTFVAGSSMGGLISMYAICEYPNIFGGAACLSTHWPGTFSVENNPIPDAFVAYLRNHLPAPKQHRIYFDYGTETLDRLYKPLQEKVDVVMKEKKYPSALWTTREFTGKDHSEKAWKERLAIPMIFVMSPSKK